MFSFFFINFAHYLYIRILLTKMIESNNKNDLIQWLVLLGDILTYFVIVHGYVYIFPGHTPLSVLHHPELATSAGSVCLLLMSLIMPTIIHARIFSWQRVIFRNIVVAIFAQMLFATLWHFMIVDHNSEMAYNIAIMSMLSASLICVRLLEGYLLGCLRKRGRNTRSILFVGNNPANLVIYNEIASNPTTGYRVAGYYSSGELGTKENGLIKLGSLEDFENIISSTSKPPFSVDEIYCSLGHSRDDEEFIQRIMKFCDRNIIHFFFVPRIFTGIQMLLKPVLVGDMVLFTDRREQLGSLGNRIVKRLFDIIFSSIVLLCMLPFLPIIALIIKRQSPGPVFFHQERTGMSGKSFMCHKFRSMRVNKEADVLQATKNDTRLFPFGAFMRKTNIDELPQFWNVLKGEMSIVGPRPHMTKHTEQYSKLIEKYMVRHAAKPGITGLAQVSGFRGETEELWQMEGRVKKDIEYLERWTFMLDLKIIFQTALSIIVVDEHAY